MKTYITTSIMIAAVLLIAYGLIAHREAEQSIFDSLAQEQPLSVTIETDWTTLLANKHSKAGLPASFSYVKADGSSAQWDATIKTRGKNRLELCDFPPLKLEFEANDLLEAGLSSFSSLKLVTQCKNDEQLLLKEYLAYELYRKLTDKSFRVQLARITYRDTHGRVAPFEQYALILENSKEMAQRLNARMIETEQTGMKTIDAEQYRLLTVFQYMIGNTDWGLDNGHNVKFIQLEEMPAPTPVPYDFDYAGLVNAPYAKPHPKLPISKVTQRMFQWRGKDPEALQQTLALFRQKKSELMQTVYTIYGLEEQERQYAIKYLESFFEIINSKAINGHTIVSRMRAPVTEGIEG